MKWTVIDNETGKEPDLENIAIAEKWADGLMYCDMLGFAIDQEGDLILMDECGSYCCVPAGRFTVRLEIS